MEQKQTAYFNSLQQQQHQNITLLKQELVTTLHKQYTNIQEQVNHIQQQNSTKLHDHVTKKIDEIKATQQTTIAILTKQLQETITTSIAQFAQQSIAPIQQQLNSFQTTFTQEINNHVDALDLYQTQIQELTTKQQHLQTQYFQVVDSFIPQIDIPSVTQPWNCTEQSSSSQALTMYTPPSPYSHREPKLARHTPPLYQQDHPMSPRGYKRPSKVLLTQPSPHPSQQLLLNQPVLGEEQK